MGYDDSIHGISDGHDDSGCGIRGCTIPGCDYDTHEESKFQRTELEIPLSLSVVETIGRAYGMVRDRFYKEYGYMPEVPRMMFEINFTVDTCWIELSVEVSDAQD